MCASPEPSALWWFWWVVEGRCGYTECNSSNRGGESPYGGFGHSSRVGIPTLWNPCVVGFPCL